MAIRFKGFFGVRKPSLIRFFNQSISQSYSHTYNYNPDPFGTTDEGGIDEIHQNFKLHDSRSLSKFINQPNQIRCLARDFIHDSLYNPNYGYFSKKVEIFENEEEEDADHEAQDDGKGRLRALKRIKLFQKSLDSFDQLQSEETPKSSENLSKANHKLVDVDQSQIWHTPTELFKPWYSRCVANHILKFHQSKPLKPLKIYEIGAGNGTLCQGIMDHIEYVNPDLYKITTYTTIEVSSKLSQRQKARSISSGHSDKVRVINTSVLDPDPALLEKEEEECWVLGFEVLDNLTRDVIRTDYQTGQTLQSMVIVDQKGNFHERFIPVNRSNNPNLSNYLEIFSKQINSRNRTPSLNKLKSKWVPFYPNLSQPEFIPTSYNVLLKNIFKYFPNHKLIFSDFNELPNTIEGIEAPVVQTRLNGMVIPVTTYLVKQGSFDIFFPTNFENFRILYKNEYNLQHQDSNLIKNSINQTETDRTEILSKTSVSLKIYDHLNFFLKNFQEVYNKKTISKVDDKDFKNLTEKTYYEFDEEEFKLIKLNLEKYYQNVKVITSL
ncbi:S-adenosyl-L-methionine-dependent methyltransferase [Phakopsora pachyrhizi]|nr:S-adenosyl-L-methionine-dependent methyltransferase [Phakopsora pachyrhizi]